MTLVDPEGPQEDNTMTQIKANKLMVNLFACDCGNCIQGTIPPASYISASFFLRTAE